MVAISSKISNKAIIKLLATVLVLSVLNVAYYWFNDNFILTGDPQHPHRPPFDNIFVRMIIREVGIWLFYLLSYLALNINGIKSQIKLLLYLTLVLDILTILLAAIRLIFPSEIISESYNLLIGLLNSNTFFTVLVLLHYISKNRKSNS